MFPVEGEADDVYDFYELLNDPEEYIILYTKGESIFKDAVTIDTIRTMK